MRRKSNRSLQPTIQTGAIRRRRPDCSSPTDTHTPSLSFSVFLSISAHSHPGWGWWWWPFLGVMGSGGRGVGRDGRTAAVASFSFGQRWDGTYAILSFTRSLNGGTAAGSVWQARTTEVSVNHSEFWSSFQGESRSLVQYRNRGRKCKNIHGLSLYKAGLLPICIPKATPYLIIW